MSAVTPHAAAGFRPPSPSRGTASSSIVGASTQADAQADWKRAAKAAPELAAPPETKVSARAELAAPPARLRLRRPGLLRRYGLAGAVALGLHAALALLWPETSAPRYGAALVPSDAPGTSGTAMVELALTDDDDEGGSLADLLTEASSVSKARPELPESVATWEIDPSAFIQEAAAPTVVDLSAALAGQMDATLSATLRELQENLGLGGGRGGRGFGRLGQGGVLFTPNPPYPPAARREGREGVVELLVLVDGKGRAKRAEVFRSSGYDDFDESALNTVLTRWRFPPASDELQLIRIEFALMPRERPSDSRPPGSSKHPTAAVNAGPAAPAEGFFTRL